MNAAYVQTGNWNSDQRKAFFAVVGSIRKQEGLPVQLFNQNGAGLLVKGLGNAKAVDYQDRITELVEQFNREHDIVIDEPEPVADEDIDEVLGNKFQGRSNIV